MKHFLSIPIFLFLMSCQTAETEHSVTVENKYSITLPANLKSVTSLNDEASLQYQDPIRELYIIVLDETKQEAHAALDTNNLTDRYEKSLLGYTKLMIDNFNSTIEISKQSEISDTLINGMPSKLYHFTGKTNGIDAYFSLAFLEGREKYYQLMTWTLASNESQHSGQMKKMINSFREL